METAAKRVNFHFFSFGYLGIGRPVGDLLERLPDVLIFQDVERRKLDSFFSQYRHSSSAEAAPRSIRSALHEHHRLCAEKKEKKTEEEGEQERKGLKPNIAKKFFKSDSIWKQFEQLVDMFLTGGKGVRSRGCDPPALPFRLTPIPNPRILLCCIPRHPSPPPSLGCQIMIQEQAGHAVEHDRTKKHINLHSVAHFQPFLHKAYCSF